MKQLKKLKMWNLLSNFGISFTSELCAWSVLGVIRTTFDATLFHINANLKKVWSLKMPEEIYVSVQRVLRTMISGVVLVQVFTVHLYLATYIILLYPVFLEERPSLVLPWLLVSAIRGLLCELLGLALGLTSCLLVGATRSPCIVFVLGKLVNIVPAVYMWILVFNFYQSLKMMTSLTFSMSSGSVIDVIDHGLELAIRRRKTKSLFGEAALRKHLITSCGHNQMMLPTPLQPFETQTRQMFWSPHVTTTLPTPKLNQQQEDVKDTEDTKENASSSTLNIHQKDTKPAKATITDTDMKDFKSDKFRTRPVFIESGTCENRITSIDMVTFEEWFNYDLPPRRNTDRVLDQFVAMILKVASYVTATNAVCLTLSQVYPEDSQPRTENCMSRVDAETFPQAGSSMRPAASYIRDYPQIFNKRRIDPILRLDPWVISSALVVREESVQTDNDLDSSQGNVPDKN